MAEEHVAEDHGSGERSSRARLLGGILSCILGALLAALTLLAALQGAGANITAGALGIGLCILGYYLDARKLATATIILCAAAIIFSLAASQGFVPGIEPSNRAGW